MRAKVRQINRIRAYLGKRLGEHEKSPPRIFVGREHEIQTVLAFQKYWQPGKTAGETHVVSGAPGAGKTSLVHEIAQRWVKEDGAVSIVREEVPESEQDVRDLYREIAVALGAMEPGEDRVTHSSGSTADANVGVVKGGLSSGQSVTPPDVGSTWAIANLPGYDAGKAAQKRVAVFIDEIQNIPPDERAPGAKLVRYLHTQKSLPIVLVCSGLGDSKLKISEAGTTRIIQQHVHRIGALPMGDSVDCVRRNLQQAREDAGLPASDAAIQRWAETMARASDQWPRHLHCYLSAIWSSLSEMPEPDLDKADISTALEQGKSLRSKYYQDRVSEARVDISILHALTSRAAKSGVSLGDAVDIIEQAAGNLSSGRRTMHNENFRSSKACLDHMFHVGIVTHDSDELYSVPIPTMTEYIEQKYNAPKISPNLDGPAGLATGMG